jgi:hypothetical protein
MTRNDRWARYLTIVGLAITAAVCIAPPARATDNYPCTGSYVFSWTGGTTVKRCPLAAPLSGNRVPVYRDSVTYDDPAYRVGWLDFGQAQYFYCERDLINIYHHPLHPSWQNYWWAETVADNGRPGIVPEVYFRGGANYEPDAGLGNCF